MDKENLKLVKTYQYCDEDGNVIYEKLRYEPKTFRQRRAVPDGWSWGLTADTRKVLYRLPEVIRSSEIFITEGEKDADTLVSIGLCATTNSGGGNEPWCGKDGIPPQWTHALAGKDVVILPDQDKVGQDRLGDILASIQGIVSSVAVVNVPRGKDVTDFLTNHNGTPQELNPLE